ncbi:restriction endonuclease subunit S [Bacillus sp. 28A-2]|uniref:restriction endonuclease subunit S n=1 Tax=Bacillus sp. 28A-2 TaxID=2772252 RepID=UPI00168D66B9|nr:restriction endonuclease subunit S [Bacillus sp. 28A-2]MBD3860244.1 restriction endonuclease subunit S [Bacillus sp. 28A-2]
MGSKRVPEVRFNGFSEEWQVCKLFEVAEFNPRSSLPEQFRYVDLGSVVGTNLISYRTELKKTAPSRAQRLAKRGDVFYQMVRPYQKNNFLFDLPYADFVFSTGYAQLRPYGNSYFLLSRLQESRFVSNVLDRSTGTSYPAINSNDLAQIEIKVPKKEVEQTQIGNFFKQLDETITIQQQELDTLKQTKQGFLQKMFPKEGESLPEIRFPGFNEKWIHRNILEVSKVFIGLVTTMTENYRKSGTLLIRNSDIKENRFEFSNEPIHLDESFAEQHHTRRLIVGDVVTVHTGDIGTSAVITKRECGSIGFATINSRPNSNLLDSNYLATFLNTQRHKKYAIKMSTGDGRSNYNLKDFTKLNIPLPSIEEQNKIGLFFKSFDEKITLKKKTLDILQQTKKAFLQKMFV